ncbi:DNA replication factor C complex subunit Rfc1 [Cryptotrichosporon argae]
MPNPATPSPKKQSQKASETPGTGRDIRNFFGQGSSAPVKKESSANLGTGSKPIAIDNSDDDDVKPAARQSKPSSSKHFASSSKRVVASPSPEPMPAAAKGKRALVEDSDEDVKPAKKRQPLAPAPKREAAMDVDGVPNGVNGQTFIFTGELPGISREKAEQLVESKGGIVVRGKPTTETTYAVIGEAAGEKKMTILQDFGIKLLNKAEFMTLIKSTSGGTSAGNAGRKATVKEVKPSGTKVAKKEAEELTSDEEEKEEEEEEVKPKPKPRAQPVKKETKPAKASTPKKKAAASKGKGEDEKPKVKFDFRAAAAARAAGPSNPGSKEVPVGEPGCLAGLTFVFTGELESLGREEAIELAKRYSGRVTTAPSSKTSYVVVGINAGQSKLEKIKALGLATINEDEFLELIRGRKGGEVDEKTKAAIEKEEKKVLEQANEMERREKEEERLRVRKEKALEGTGIAAKKAVPTTAQLWTTKYAPTNIKEICGNKAPVERLHQWLLDWQKCARSGFKKPGKDGMGLYRAVLISGPPGIGKTTSAHLVAKMAGYNPLELNASDARSKKLVENATNIDNASLDGFLQGKGVQSTTVTDLKLGSRTCLIMDEVDGMSAGDRGGVGALNTLIKKTKIPMILICNDRTLQKMKPLWSTTFNMTFRRPQASEIRSRIMSILYKEKLKIPANVVDELVQGVNSDIRQVLNMLSTFKLSKSDMSFDEGKQLAKINEKNTIMTPFTIIDKLTGPYAFSRTSKETLGDKMELYFHDFSFVPLFMQEHYLKTNPSALNNMEGSEKALKHLELVSKAADSISDGDLIDRLIHGSEQHWSLLPLHAVASTVRPASYIYGPMQRSGGNGPGAWGPSFPQWLGQNSKQNKLGRQLTDIQIKMRLKVSGSKDEVRQQYMPMLANKIVLPLCEHGQDAIEETIGTMDDYYLGKDDWDAFVELGVDTMRDELLLKKIPTAVKTAFTRTYNKNDHPIAFHKGDMFAASKKKIADLGPAPDNDDVFEDDEPVAEDDDEAKDDDDDDVNDLGKDRLIKAVKPKGKAAAKKAETKKGKK